MSAPEQTLPWAWLAHIRRTQGRKGEVFADILTDFPERFAERRQLWLVREGPQTNPPVEVQLINYWLHKGGVVLHFEGVDSITAAEALKGFYVAIPKADRAPLGEGEAYITDLVGCLLVDVAPAVPLVVGEIEDVDRSAGPVSLLIVRSPHGETLVPFAKDYVRRIDLDGRRVEMALPEGLLDLNTPDG